MRQRTSRVSVRVSHRRTSRADSQSASGLADAERRWWVRTAGRAIQSSRRSSARYGDGRGMRLIQHKKEAYWFYRFLSTGYDRWVNPLFWTPAMRTAALDAARLDERRLRTLDAGAGTGFTTEGIVERVDAKFVTMLDQSPHQLSRAERKPSLAACAKLLGDAEALPLPTDHFDRYVSAGSIEYWPAPERGIAEAYRVLKPGGVALVAGPVPPGDRVLRWLAELWMLFPTEAQYREWFERAGFEDVSVTAVAPGWYRDPRSQYAVAVSGRKAVAGESPAGASGGAVEDVREPMGWRRRAVFAGRFVLGSLAGFVFVPVGAVLALRRRR
jgi:MPBQ/MSBQ methyltransferase